MAEQFGINIGVEYQGLLDSIRNAIAKINGDNSLQGSPVSLNVSLNAKSAIANLKKELAGIKINIDVPKLNLGVNTGAVYSSLAPEVDDSLVNAYRKNFNIISRSAEYSSAQIRDAFKNAISGVFNAKAIGDETGFKSAMEELLALTQKFTSLKQAAKKASAGFNTGDISLVTIEDFLSKFGQLLALQGKEVDGAKNAAEAEKQVTAAVNEQVPAMQSAAEVAEKLSRVLTQIGAAKGGTLANDFGALFPNISNEAAVVDALGRAFDRLSSMPKDMIGKNMSGIMSYLEHFSVGDISVKEFTDYLASIGTAANNSANQVKQTAEVEKNVSKELAAVSDNSIKKVEERTVALKEQTKAINEQEKAFKNVNAARIRTTRTRYDTTIDKTYGTAAENTTLKYKNGELISTTEVKNYAKANAEADKLKAVTTKLRSDVGLLKSDYMDMNNARPISKDSKYFTELEAKYNEIIAVITEMENSGNKAFLENKAKVEGLIKSLKQLIGIYREAEYAGEKLRPKDISTLKDIETRWIDAFVSKLTKAGIPIDAMQRKIDELRAKIAGVSDRKGYVGYLNQKDIFLADVEKIKAEYSAVGSIVKSINTDIKALNNLSKSAVFRNNPTNDEVAKKSAEISELLTKYEQLQTAMSNAKTPEDVAKCRTELDALRASSEKLKIDVVKLNNTFKTSNDVERFTAKFDALNSKIAQFERLNTKALTTINPNTNNTFGADLNALKGNLAGIAGTKDMTLLKQYEDQFKSIDNTVKALGITGNTVLGDLWAQIKKFTQWMGITYFITRVRMYIRQLFTNVYELDTALVDLRKTFKGTNAQLEEFYLDANKIAKEMGVTTKEIIEQGSAWSRLN